PAAIAQKAKAQVLHYPTVTFLQGIAIDGKKKDNGFTITVKSGEEFNGRKLLFATGVRDLFPAIKGFAECWGISVVHCPYCHGYEFREAKTGIMANGERAFHLASLVRNLTDKISFLTTGTPQFSLEQLSKLKNRNIGIIETEVAEIIHDNGQVKQVIFKDGSQVPFEAVYAAIPFEQHSDIPEALGCELTEQGYLKVDMLQKTAVAGVFACGDNTSMMRSVAAAVAGGNLAGAAINREITEEDF
ncbi:MAG: NAD(P)/FAD-dependent oxidoreductase, partial [Chitinophagaceae bacterium]